MSKRTWTENEEKYRPDFDRALEARDRGERARAIELLLEVCDHLEARDTRLATHSHLQLSNLNKLEGDSESRLRHAIVAAQISPRFELASVALFHAMLGVGRTEDAMREMVRYVSAKDSPMYRELLGVGYSLELPMAELELAVEARKLLREREEENAEKSEPGWEKPEPGGEKPPRRPEPG